MTKKAPRGQKPRPGKAPGKLTDRQRRFIAEYLVDLNATQAAIRAGYSRKTAGAIGAENLTKPDVAKAIEEGVRALLAKPISEAERVVVEAKRLAYSDIRQIFDERGELRPVHELPDDTAAAISSIKVTERTKGRGADAEIETTKEYRLWDKGSMVTLLARYHALLTDRSEVKVDGDLTITQEQASKMTDDEIEAKLAELADEVAQIASAHKP